MKSLLDFETLLQKIMGLDVVSVGANTVERALRERMEALRLTDLDDYWDNLTDSPAELQELIETVVVPETWFFRDADAFRLLIQQVREQRSMNRGDGLLRILSAPCATGEEPYSVVMALSDAGLALTQVKVDALDISARSIAHARRAVYGRNSFRSDNLEFRDRYFHREGHRFSLKDEIRAAVNLYEGNLVLNTFARPSAPYDAIFCRNVLIYFERSTQESVMRTLRSLLAPDGILFVGPAEAYLAASCGFTSVNFEMSFGFRKGAKSEPPVCPPINIAKRSRMSTVRKEIRPSTSPAGPVASPIEEAMRLADLGRLSEAIERCESSVELERQSVDAYYLLGVLCDAAGDRRRAGECYRRVVYMEPEHVEALMHLALLIEREGDRDGAARFRERARRLSERKA